jgi:hypothetical protein
MSYSVFICHLILFTHQFGVFGHVVCVRFRDLLLNGIVHQAGNECMRFNLAIPIGPLDQESLVKISLGYFGFADHCFGQGG